MSGTLFYDISDGNSEFIWKLNALSSERRRFVPWIMISYVYAAVQARVAGGMTVVHVEAALDVFAIDRFLLLHIRQKGAILKKPIKLFKYEIIFFSQAVIAECDGRNVCCQRFGAKLQVCQGASSSAWNV